MHRFQNILAYVSVEDEKLAAVDQAAAIAHAEGAAITILRVIEASAPARSWIGRRIGRDEELRQLLESSQRLRLDARAEELRGEGLDVRVDVRFGTPWIETLYAVLRDGHDLVVKTAEGVARGGGLFFGSTALHLIRKCPCPVWVTSGRRRETGARVLAAIDPGEGETRQEIAERILSLGTGVAGAGGALHVATAWRAVGEMLLARRIAKEELDEYVEDERRDAADRVAALLADVEPPVEPTRVHLLHGHARDVLPRFVETEDFDLVVLGSLGRTGVAGLLIGETAETLIRSVRCSVLVVKPSGFVCPVTLPAEANRERVS